MGWPADCRKDFGVAQPQADHCLAHRRPLDGGAPTTDQESSAAGPEARPRNTTVDERTWLNARRGSRLSSSASQHRCSPASCGGQISRDSMLVTRELRELHRLRPGFNARPWAARGLEFRLRSMFESQITARSDASYPGYRGQPGFSVPPTSGSLTPPARQPARQRSSRARSRHQAIAIDQRLSHLARSSEQKLQPCRS